jgi:hypothetical protein
MQSRIMIRPARLLFQCLLLLTIRVAVAGTSANYTLAPEAVDRGGLTGGSANYTVNSSASPGGAGSSTIYAAYTGYAGQLFETIPDAQPEIVVEQPAGTNVNDGANRSFGDVPVSANTSLTFTIRNTGTAPLTSLDFTIQGADASMFTVTAAPATTVAQAGSTTFSVVFTPVSAGAKTAILRIANDDADESPFDITLTGSGRTIVVDMDFTSFRLTGAGGRDVEVKFATSSGESYRVLKSPSMAPGSWTDAGIMVTGTGDELTIVLPNIGLNLRLFFRVVKL